ncbi:MAG: hypothetical protein K5886_07525 [Lachnospiraceae bacterium]|nr:hypothetical protein [Lachnospiraceae bacterium]
MSFSINSMLGMPSSNKPDTSVYGTISLSEYASVKNGSYAKLAKSYYANQKAESQSEAKDSDTKLSSIRSDSDSLKTAADALTSKSLWEKKTITKTDEATGEETKTEDYDWDAITKAVKGFADAYNKTLDSSVSSDTKGVLLNAGWMVGNMGKFDNLLSKAGISTGADNKLSVDEEELKKADISTLKVLFSNPNSLADQVSSKASAISRAAANAGGNTYTSNGTIDSLYQGFSTEI